ncbi:DNA-binding transcriptional regulator, GntR family [Sphingobium faniae]|nr:DNA-binding transcriptional regulator, GntR family [Sphingobium faniae]
MRSFYRETPPVTKKGSPSIRSNLAGQIAQMIDNLIADGHLMPGQRLIEQELADQLGVSRLPVREALRVLAGDGIVEIIPNAGARVRVLHARHINETSKVLIALMGVALDELETLVDRDAIIAELETIVTRMSAAAKAKDAAEVAHGSVQFQLKLFDRIENECLKEVFRKIRIGNYQGQVRNLFQDSTILQFATHYPDVVKNLKAGNYSKAKKAFVKGLNLLTLLEKDPNPPVGPLPRDARLRRNSGG